MFNLSICFGTEFIHRCKTHVMTYVHYYIKKYQNDLVLTNRVATCGGPKAAQARRAPGGPL